MVFTRKDLLAEVSDRLLAMRKQEAAHYVIPDYLAAEWQLKLRDATEPDEVGIVPVAIASSTAAVPSSSSDDDDNSSKSSADLSQINELWREKICEWCYLVVDHFDFNREVVSVAMSYLDRYLVTRAVNRRIFQLAGMTALYLAIKLFETEKLGMSSLINLTRGYFRNEHIIVMEESMLRSLDWYVHPPTPFAFCMDLMSLISSDVSLSARHDLAELARFITELSVCDYWFVTKKPSFIALASLINAIELQGPHIIDPIYKDEFLHRVAEIIGIDIVNDKDFLDCYERLRETYNAGEFTPNHREGAVGQTNSPAVIADLAGEGDGPNADDLNEGADPLPSARDRAQELNARAPTAARATSPNAVIPETPPTSRKRKNQSSTQCYSAKKARVNLSREGSRDANPRTNLSRDFDSEEV